MIKLIYSDIAVGSREAFQPSAEGADGISHIEQIAQAGLNFPEFSTICELNQTFLDGSMRILPDDTSEENIGLWSTAITDSDGDFSTFPTLTMTAAGLYTSQGITITTGDAYPASVNIKWYRDGEVLSDMDFTPDSNMYYCENRVDSYNQIIVTFHALVLPHRRLKLRGLVHGRIREFDGHTLSGISIIQECSPISAEIAINTLDFTLRGDTAIDYVFQTRQSLEIYSNDDMLGVFFVRSYGTDDIQSRSRFYHVSAEDYFGLLDQLTFVGGIYNNKNAYELMAAMLDNAHVPHEIDESLKSETVSGWIPVCTCREAIRQICFAIGAAADTTLSHKVRIFRPSDEVVRHFSLRDIMQGQTLTDRDRKLTEVRMTVHGFSAGDRAVKAYDAQESGTGSNIYVEFSDPLYNLTISSGTIVESVANYAIINAQSGCVLSGTQYTHTKTMRSKRNPIVNAGDPENIIKVENMTLVTAANADARLNAVYDYYAVQGVIESDLIMARVGNTMAARPGDRIEIETVKSGVQTAWLESMRYNLYGGAVVAETQAR